MNITIINLHNYFPRLIWYRNDKIAFLNDYFLGPYSISLIKIIVIFFGCALCWTYAIFTEFSGVLDNIFLWPESSVRKF